jgi:hypothetical protein
VTERASRPGKAQKAARDGSSFQRAEGGVIPALGAALRRGGVAGLIVLVLGVAGAGLMVAAELSTYRTIDVQTASCTELADPSLAETCKTSGGEQHSWALVPVALLVLLMAWGAGPGRSRPAAIALAVAGLVTLGIAVVGDLPSTDATGAIGRDFDQARGVAGPTIALEIVGAALVLAAAGLRLARRE